MLYIGGGIIASITAGRKCLPHQWKNANIILTYKLKGDRAECDNSRAISILYAAGIVLAKIMLTRLLEHVVDLGLSESQWGLAAWTQHN